MDRNDEKKRCRSPDQIPETRRTLVISHVLAHAIRPVESRETNDGEGHANSGCVQKKNIKTIHGPRDRRKRWFSWQLKTS